MGCVHRCCVAVYRKKKFDLNNFSIFLQCIPRFFSCKKWSAFRTERKTNKCIMKCLLSLIMNEVNCQGALFSFALLSPTGSTECQPLAELQEDIPLTYLYQTQWIHLYESRYQLPSMHFLHHTVYRPAILESLTLPPYLDERYSLI